MSLPLFAIVNFVTSDDTSLGTFRVPMTSETTVRRLAKDAMQRLVLSRRGNDCTLAAYQPLKISEVYVLCNLIGNTPQRAEVFASDLVVNVVSVREEVIYMTLQNSTQSTTTTTTTAAQDNKELEMHSTSTSTSASSTQDTLSCHKESNADYNKMMSSHRSETEQSVNKVSRFVNEAANICGEPLSNAQVNTLHHEPITSSLSPSTLLKTDASALNPNKIRVDEISSSPTTTITATKASRKTEENAHIKITDIISKSNTSDEIIQNVLGSSNTTFFETTTTTTTNIANSVNNVKSNKTNTTSDKPSKNKCIIDKQVERKQPEQRQQETNTRKRQRNCESDNNYTIKTDGNKENNNNSNSATKRIRICRIELDAESEERIRELREREMARAGWPKSSYHNKNYADNYVSSPDKLMRRPSKKHKSSTKHEAQSATKQTGCSNDACSKLSNTSKTSNHREERHVTFSAEHDRKKDVETRSTSTASSPAYREQAQQHTVDVDADDMDSSNNNDNSDDDNTGNKAKHINGDCINNNDNKDNNVHLRSVTVSSYFVNSPQHLTSSSSSSSSSNSLLKQNLVSANQIASELISTSDITQESKCASVSSVDKKDQYVDVVCDAGKAISRKIAVARQLLFSQIDCTNESTPTGRSTMAHVVQSYDEDHDVEVNKNNNNNESSKINISLHKDDKYAEKEVVSKEETKTLKTRKDATRQRSPEQPLDKKSLGWGWDASKFFDPETYCDDPNKAHLVLRNRNKRNDAAVTKL